LSFVMSDASSRYMPPEDQLALLLESAATTVVRLKPGSSDLVYAQGRLSGIAEALSVYVAVPAFDIAVAARERAQRRVSGTGNGARVVLSTANAIRGDHALRRQA
jgi:hypothetical protein